MGSSGFCVEEAVLRPTLQSGMELRVTVTLTDNVNCTWLQGFQ